MVTPLALIYQTLLKHQTYCCVETTRVFGLVSAQSPKGPFKGPKRGPFGADPKWSTENQLGSQTMALVEPSGPWVQTNLLGFLPWKKEPWKTLEKEFSRGGSKMGPGTPFRAPPWFPFQPKWSGNKPQDPPVWLLTTRFGIPPKTGKKCFLGI